MKTVRRVIHDHRKDCDGGASCTWTEQAFGPAFGMVVQGQWGKDEAYFEPHTTCQCPMRSITIKIDQFGRSFVVSEKAVIPAMDPPTLARSKR
jgi:hypothetical protein